MKWTGSASMAIVVGFSMAAVVAGACGSDVTETPGGTNLKLTHAGHDTFPNDNPIFSRESGEAGWRYFLNESLKAFLERIES